MALAILLFYCGLAVGSSPLYGGLRQDVLRTCSKTGCSKTGRNQAEGFMRVDADLCRWCTTCQRFRAFDRLPAEKGAAAAAKIFL